MSQYLLKTSCVIKSFSKVVLEFSLEKSKLLPSEKVPQLSSPSPSFPFSFISKRCIDVRERQYSSRWCELWSVYDLSSLYSFSLGQTMSIFSNRNSQITLCQPQGYFPVIDSYGCSICRRGFSLIVKN